MTLKGHDYIKATRDYCDYLEEHFNNIEKAFLEVTKACDGLAVVGDDKAYFDLKSEVEHHDLSKFSSHEFTQYRVKWFPVESQTLDSRQMDADFNKAWVHHYLHNTHHAESIRSDPKYPGITEHDLVHMIIDWTAMGYKFGDTAEKYYNANSHKIDLKRDQIAFIKVIFKRLRTSNE